MIHVVFNEPDLEVLKKAMALDDSLTGTLKLIRDDYAVGPLHNIFTPEGAAFRKNWWKMVLEGGDYAGWVADGKVDDEQTMLDIIALLTAHEKEVVWIWAAQNKHDVCGYYWMVSQLASFQNRIQILYLNNLPFINEKGNIFYPQWLSQIPPKEFLKAKKLARAVSISEFEVDGDEWRKICSQDSMVRLLEGGKKLLLKEVDYYDTELIRYILPDAQKASKIIQSFQSKNKETTGDGFLLWRLKTILLQNEKYEVIGKMGAMKDFEIKKKSILETNL